MKKLLFNREAARKDYLQDFPDLKKNKRKLELLLLRGELLARNPLFIKEWEELQTHPQNRNAFDNRWGIISYFGIYESAAKDLVADIIAADWPNETVSIKVDLRYSKRRIISAIERILDLCQVAPSIKEGKVSADLEDSLKALEVWDLREVKKASWSEIHKQLKLNNIQAARNWHKKADELINKGVPTLPLFPQK